MRYYNFVFALIMLGCKNIHQDKPVISITPDSVTIKSGDTTGVIPDTVALIKKDI